MEWQHNVGGMAIVVGVARHCWWSGNIMLVEWLDTVGGVAIHCWWSGNIMLVEWQHNVGGVAT